MDERIDKPTILLKMWDDYLVQKHGMKSFHKYSNCSNFRRGGEIPEDFRSNKGTLMRTVSDCLEFLVHKNSKHVFSGEASNNAITKCNGRSNLFSQ